MLKSLNALSLVTVAALLLTGQAQGQPSSIAEGEAETLARLRRVAQAVEANPTWEIRRVPSPTNPTLEVSSYRKSDVLEDVSAIRSALDDAIGDSPLLQAYVAIQIPSGGGFASTSGAVLKDDADRLWARLVRAVRGLGQLSSLSVDLEVVSLPRDGAAVRLSALGLEDEVRSTRTTGTLSRVWRGLYRYEVIMEDVVVWEGRLDLVQERGTRLVCIEPDRTSAAPIPCRLEERP